MKACKLLLAAASAAALLASLVGAASARNLSFSHQTFRATYARYEFRTEVSEATRCPVTLEGSLHARTVAKVVGQLVGYYTHAAIGRCTERAITFLTETLPWHLRYAGFGGFLPSVNQVRVSIVGFAVAFTETFGQCLAVSRAEDNYLAAFNVNPTLGGQVSGMPTGGITAIGGARCIAEAGRRLTQDAGSSTTATVGGSATRITITLI